MKTITIITGTRAEYGLLKPLIRALDASSDCCLRIVATGTHLVREFGMTYKEIEADGYTIAEKIEIVLSSDTPSSMSKSMALAMMGFADFFSRCPTDMVVVLGDRYEIFAAVSAAYVAGIPVAHLHGGETSEGSLDEGFRHSITKMSYLHFASTPEYRRRIIQLGESPDRVFHSGALGLDGLQDLKLMKKADLENEMGLSLAAPFALVTYHPATLGKEDEAHRFSMILDALDRIDMRIIFTKSNADLNGREINAMIDEYVRQRVGRAKAFASLGYLRYQSLMKQADVVVGNSSSGIIEAPYHKIPTVNIGDRQKGRIQSNSVINCDTNASMIVEAIQLAVSQEFKLKTQDVVNPYYKPGAAECIFRTIMDYLDGDVELKKTFHDMDCH